MKYILWIFLIFLAIVLWHLTLLLLLLLIVYKIIQAIYRSHQRKVKNTKIEAMAPSIRRSLRKDRLLLVSVIVDVIKQHWSILEDKLELYTVEDDYGNTSLKKSFKQELIYFSEKVVLPELNRCIDTGETTNKSLTLILQDTTRIFQDIPADFFGIRFESSNQDIAATLLSAVGTSHVGDELLYELHTNPIKMENYLNEARAIFITVFDNSKFWRYAKNKRAYDGHPLCRISIRPIFCNA